MTGICTVWVDYEDKQIRMVAGELIVKPCSQRTYTKLARAKWCVHCYKKCILKGKRYIELMDIYREIVLS